MKVHSPTVEPTQEEKTERIREAGFPPESLLKVYNLVKYFPIRKGIFSRIKAWVRAVDDVTFYVKPGETLGLVGESGCGKTTVGRAILRLIEPTSGEIVFMGEDLLSLGSRDLREYRKHMQIIFQDPYSSLNPRMTVANIVSEGIRVHKMASAAEQKDQVKELLLKVGLNAAHLNRYPHEFSGGQRQRIGIARALALNPSFIVCDEPVSALDVSIQAQIINLLMDLQREFNFSYLFIAHNLAVVKHISHRVAVMYLGEIAEMASRDDLYANPYHPYTQALMSASPGANPHEKMKRFILSGDVPTPISPPPGCRFHTRCPSVMDICKKAPPKQIELGNEHYVRCHLYASSTERVDILAEHEARMAEKARLAAEGDPGGDISAESAE